MHTRIEEVVLRASFEDEMGVLLASERLLLGNIIRAQQRKTQLVEEPSQRSGEVPVLKFYFNSLIYFADE